MEGNKKSFLLNYYELKKLLDDDAFNTYSYTFLSVRFVATKTSCYFQVEDIGDDVKAICTTVDKLNEFFRGYKI